MKTINEFITTQQALFSTLSKSRKDRLKKEAREYIKKHPHMRDASTFWRGLSAQQVLAC